jgi:ABC-type sulfate/molybdate transport systems ATPase subunit
MREVDTTIISESVKALDETGTLNVSLHQRFGSFLLAVNFHVPLGLIVLFGASGAGKSLTLRSVAGLLHPKRGYVAVDRHVLFDNAAGVDLPPQERRMGYVPQHYALFPHLTVAENILFALPSQSLWTQWGKGRAPRQARVRELLNALELEGLERRYPATLSGGQQQRVALARALAAEPYLLLLDEPFNALDAAVRERLRDTLKQFQRRFAVPIVLVTHDHAEAQQLADTIVVLQQGQVVQVGSVQEIFLMPRTPYVARLVGQHNVFGGYIATPSGDQPSAPPKALRLSWLQANGVQERVLLPRSDKLDRCWLPLPLAPRFITTQPNITGCIRTDEVLVYPWPGAIQPPVWTARGAVQWRGILLDAQIHGHAMRLLVRPQWTGQPGTDIPARGDALELYLSRGQWREIEVLPGQSLLLEIGPEAIHWFETLYD